MHQNYLGACKKELLGFLSGSTESETLRGRRNLHFIRLSRRYLKNHWVRTWGAAVGDVNSRATKGKEFSEGEECTKRSVRSKVTLKRKARGEAFRGGRGQGGERKTGRNAVTWLWRHRTILVKGWRQIETHLELGVSECVVIKCRPWKWGLK